MADRSIWQARRLALIVWWAAQRRRAVAPVLRLRARALAALPQRMDPPEGAEWRWVSKPLGIGYNFERGVYMWSYRMGPFYSAQDYRRAWQHGVYIGGRFVGFIRRAS